jgi:hypothetical protein
MHRIVKPFVSPRRGDGDHAVIGFARAARPLMTHVRGLRAMRSPELLITSTPPPCGAVAGSVRSSSNLRLLTCSGSHRDSERKNCSRCTAACCASVTGSAPASAVSVLFRSRGASSPVRYSRNSAAASKSRTGRQNRAAFCSGPAPQDRAGIASSRTPE